MKSIYLFTAGYPYMGAESFLEEEIIYLSRRFDKVIIIPYKSSPLGRRSVPDNCIVQQPIVSGSISFAIKALFCPISFITLAKDFFMNKVYLSSKRFKVWLTAYAVTNSILNSSIVRQTEKKITKDDVCYFYWGKWSNILSLFWKGKARMVSRFHGQWDLWEEEYNDYAPLRRKVAESLNAAVFISQKGERYFKEKYSKCPTKVFRLGTKDVGISPRSEDGVVRVLSCSTIYPLKRVDLILQSVKHLSQRYRVEWTHLGGGDDYEKIKKMAETSESNTLKVSLLGQMIHDNILKYYVENRIDLFINLSTNEGIPVSIMEATSCDIPIVATNVGSTAEIVKDETGILVSANPQAEEVAQAMETIMKERKKITPRKFWQVNYMAEKNYTNFAEFLTSV